MEEYLNGIIYASLDISVGEILVGFPCRPTGQKSWRSSVQRRYCDAEFQEAWIAGLAQHYQHYTFIVGFFIQFNTRSLTIFYI